MIILFFIFLINEPSKICTFAIIQDYIVFFHEINRARPFVVKTPCKAILLNTICILGSLLLRNAQHADEFVQCATVIAKDFMFETKDYQIASGYSLLSYYFHLQMEKDKAVVLNTLAYNICKNLKALVSLVCKRRPGLNLTFFCVQGYFTRRSFVHAC